MNERAVQRRMARDSAKGAAHILPSASSSVTITHGRVITTFCGRLYQPKREHIMKFTLSRLFALFVVMALLCLAYRQHLQLKQMSGILERNKILITEIERLRTLRMEVDAASARLAPVR